MLRPIGLAAGAAAVLLLLAGCIGAPDRPVAQPDRLPLGIPIAIVENCEESVGLAGSMSGAYVWRDASGLHAQIGTGGGQGSGGPRPESATELALISCLTISAGPLPAYPRDSAGRLLLWKYSSTVLWPCFARHGVDVGPPPPRAAFLTADPQLIDPFDLIHASISGDLRAQLRHDCPAVPSYLANTRSGGG